MENEKERSRKLYIPVNVVESRDFVSGFGKKELAITGGALFIAVILAFIIYAVTANTIVSVGAVIFLVAGTVMAVRRNSHNESIVDQIILIHKYCQAQKRFVYEYKGLNMEWKEEKDE